MRIKTETSVGLFILVAIGIFLYMSFQIGVLRFDRSRYNQYTVYFHDISGLSKKAEVQIAGVKVGWVESVDLANDGQQVKAVIMIFNSHVLHVDAFGSIRQDGLLGTKFIEINPGDVRMPVLAPGGILMRPSHDPVSVDQILSELQVISRDIGEVSGSLKKAFGGDEGTVRLQNALDGFTRAADRVSIFAQSLECVVDRNQYSLDSILTDARSLVADLKTELPQTTRELRDGINRAVNTFDQTAGPISDVMKKLSKGEGVLGKLMSDEEMGRDIKIAVDGAKNYFNKIDQLGIVFDVHGETMYGLGEHLNIENAKGYFNVRVHPSEDYFYMLGLVGSYSGTIARQQKYRTWHDGCGCILNQKTIDPDGAGLNPGQRFRYAPYKFTEKRKMDRNLYNLQMGKTYEAFAFRGGLFDSTFGVGMDIDIPLESDAVRWVTSLEAFDFGGRNRIQDDRMHLKWLNKVFFANTLYVVFGADDFVSRYNKNAFFGVGVRFADDDVKYYLSKVTIPS